MEGLVAKMREWTMHQTAKMVVDGKSTPARQALGSVNSLEPFLCANATRQSAQSQAASSHRRPSRRAGRRHVLQGPWTEGQRRLRLICLRRSTVPTSLRALDAHDVYLKLGPRMCITNVLGTAFHGGGIFLLLAQSPGLASRTGPEWSQGPTSKAPLALMGVKVAVADYVRCAYLAFRVLDTCYLATLT
ncbi:hypothetical protein BC628DRAFT_651497 [Trametes gibbosa]|nr:hypothetical protein BC628DRAFT_651497 [Trametes gibbosa]